MEYQHDIEIYMVNKGMRPGMIIVLHNDFRGMKGIAEDLEYATIYNGLIAKVINAGFVILCLSKNKKHLDLLLRNIIEDGRKNKNGLARAFGEFCGYPKCCIDWYIKNCKDKRGYGRALIPHGRKYMAHLEGSPFAECFLKATLKKKKKGKSSKTVKKIITMYLVYISHIPCSPTCKKSLQMLEQSKKLYMKGYGKTPVQLAEGMGLEVKRLIR